MSTPSVMVALADTPRHPHLESITAVEGVPLVAAPIAPASFVLVTSTGTLAVRYQAPGDLFDAIRSHRLEADLLSLKARTDWAYLLIGSQPQPISGKCCIEGRTTGWAWDAYQGALLTAQEMGVSVVHLAHHDLVSDVLIRLVRRERGPKRVRPVREALFTDPAQEVLLAVPGIGEDKADALLDYCGGNVGAAILALTWDDAIVPPGIGPKTKEAARRVFGGVVGPLNTPDKTAPFT